MKNARLLVSLCATAALVSVAGCSTGDDGGGGGPDSTITVDNQSQSRIEDIRVGPPGRSDFGDNLLDSELLPGDSLTVLVFCDTYDIQLTDETNTTCVVQDVDVCGSDATWIITEDDLNACADFFAKDKPVHKFAVRKGAPKTSAATTSVAK